MAVAIQPADLKRQRRRARVSLAEMASRLNCGLSSLSEYENGKGDLPWELTTADYERALEDAVKAKSAA